MLSHIVAYLEPCLSLTYSESYHIQNPDTLRAWGMFRTLSRHILAYSHCVMVAYWESCHIQNFGIFRTRDIFGILFIWAYSVIFNNGSYNNINFLFFTLILDIFQQNLKRDMSLLYWRQFQWLTEST